MQILRPLTVPRREAVIVSMEKWRIYERIKRQNYNVHCTVGEGFGTRGRTGEVKVINIYCSVLLWVKIHAQRAFKPGIRSEGEPEARHGADEMEQTEEKTVIISDEKTQTWD